MLCKYKSMPPASSLSSPLVRDIVTRGGPVLQQNNMNLDWGVPFLEPGRLWLTPPPYGTTLFFLLTTPTTLFII